MRTSQALRFTAFLALCLGAAEAAGPVPPVNCRLNLQSEAAIAAHYRIFRSYSEKAYANYLRMNGRQKKCLLEFEAELVRADRGSPTTGLANRLFYYPGLTPRERGEVAEILGVGEATAGAALDRYRENYQYLFWSDHSERHMTEVIQRSRELSTDSPPEFLGYFGAALVDPQWHEWLDRAIRLHDSRMSISRSQHAEMLLDFDEATFPEHWTLQSKVTASVLAMLHSKSAVPYSVLPRWKEVIRDEIVPKLVREGSLSASKGETIVAGIAKIDSDAMARAAAWLRISDAARPIGKELRNSLEYPYFLSDDGLRAFLRTPSGDVLVEGAQQSVTYGQLALGNFRLKSAGSGKFTVEFPFLLTGPLGARVRSEIENFGVVRAIVDGTAKAKLEKSDLSAEARAVVDALVSTLGDFPSELLRKVGLELK